MKNKIKFKIILDRVDIVFEIWYEMLHLFYLHR